jgi:hypothetical protein
MPNDPQLDAALRDLDATLRRLEESTAPEPPAEPVAATLPQRDSLAGGAAPPDVAAPAPGSTSATLTRLCVGAALLGLDKLAARSGAWEAAAGIAPQAPAPAPAEGAIGSGSFRHALIGWIFESEARLRPQGNPISWLRNVVRYLFGTIFTVLLDLLPVPRPGARRPSRAAAEPTDADTQRWMALGRAEAEPSRRFAQAALEDTIDGAILYLARRPAVARALGEIVRSPAMDDAVGHVLAGPAVDQAMRRVAASPALDETISRVAQSPALDEAVTRIAQAPAMEQAVSHIVRTPAMEQAVSHIVRTPAMEDAVTYLVGTPAMNSAIDTLSQSPALVTLVTTQGTTVASEIRDQVRAGAARSDSRVEALIRRVLRRRPRAALPRERRGLMIDE